MSKKSRPNNGKSIEPDEPIDVEKLRTDLVLVCDQLLMDLNKNSQVDQMKIIMQHTDPNNKNTFQKLLKLHDELVLKFEQGKSLLVKADSVGELATIYCDLSNGVGKKQTQLDNLLREAIEKSRSNFRSKGF